MAIRTSMWVLRRNFECLQCQQYAKSPISLSISMFLPRRCWSFELMWMGLEDGLTQDHPAVARYRCGSMKWSFAMFSSEYLFSSCLRLI
ncbi:hypothetical protein NPIL_575201 [Nephila pilipes]|uniref:Uncharacterized protein n=1 Tax=Nephila pilipes TaxID=299642 RepID=A0A8X6QEW1_NEPPI|nr:hypothetical protein NPIL_575201 [Nephila pilipes]